MKFKINRDHFSNGLAQVLNVVGSKATMPILSNVLIEGRDQGTLHVHGCPEMAGRALFATLQGSGLVCRLFKTSSRLRDVIGAMRVQPANV